MCVCLYATDVSPLAATDAAPANHFADEAAVLSAGAAAQQTVAITPRQPVSAAEVKASVVIMIE